MMMWIYIATGFTGALSLVIWLHQIYRLWNRPVTIEVYHSPKGGCTEAVVRELHSARREILMQAYSFTSKPIANALLEAKKRGVHVDIILDKSNEQETHTELGDLEEHGLIPHIDAQHAIAHNKLMIIDRSTIITGSFNFTNQAEHENAENLVIIKHDHALARSYIESFEHHKGHSHAPGQKAKKAA